MDGQRVGAGGRQIRVDGQARRSRQAAGIVIGETIRVIHRQAEQQGINAQKWSPGQIKTSHWGAGTTVFYGEWCECVYWWQVQTISPRYVGGESNELVIRRGLPLVVWERRCKGLVCNRAPPPWERLLTRGGWRRRGLPRGRGAGFSGCDLWNSSVRAGSRMSLALTQDLSSGPYPSQSTRYWSIPPWRRESRSYLTWYASSPSSRMGGGIWVSASSFTSPSLGPPAGFNSDTWKVGEIR